MKNLYKSNEWTDLKEQVAEWKKTGHKLVFTNGCFDILHDGHKALFEFVKQHRGKSIVGLNSDDSVRRLKGEGRPVNNTAIRADNILNTGLIDVVAIFEEDTPQEILELLEPDVLIKGDDYTIDTTVGAHEVETRGGQVVFFKKLPGLSTTGILKERDKKD